MPDLTRAQLDELLAAEARATPGEWEVNPHYLHRDDQKGSRDTGGDVCYTQSRYVEGPTGCVCMTNSRTRDVELIALMRNNFRVLCEMAKRAIPEPPVEIKAVIIARHNRVRVSEDDATAVVDWMATFIMPEVK